MNKAKVVFNQTLMISTAILFGLGVQTSQYYMMGNVAIIEWPWYIPFSIILTGFLCSVPSLLFIEDEKVSSKHMKIRIALHFICLLGVVSLCGYLFHWYNSLSNYIPIVIMYVLIYCFVWLATLWMTKSDENKINEAIRDIQDEE